MQMAYGLVSLSAVWVLFGAIVTAPIWATVLILNLPLIIGLVVLGSYTNVRKAEMMTDSY